MSWTLPTDRRRKQKEKLHRQEKALLLVLLAALLVGCWLPGRLIVSTSPSLKHRIFFLVPPPARPEVGDYLVFRHGLPQAVRRGLRRGNRVIKRVGCVPGEQLTTNGCGTFCSGRFLGTSLTQDSHGRALTLFHFNGTVPAQSYYMVGEHPRSFDSRYFGFIHDDAILYKALPLW